MKNKFIYIATTVLGIALTGCSKDFLHQTPTDVVAAEDLETAVNQDPSLLSGNVAGLYSTMLITGTGGVGSHSDFGQKGYDIFSDMLVGDMALLGVNYGHYRDLAQLTAPKDFTSNTTYAPWRYYYRIIFSANTVIDALGGTDFEPTEAGARHIMGQAKAMRAYAYFYLANLYSPKGYGTGADKILPLYKDTKIPNQPLSSAEEVFKLIESDLKDAITLLDNFNRTSKDQINKYVAKGLLAYALSARGSQSDLQEVITLTNDVLTNGGHPLTTRDQVVARLSGTTLLNPESGFNDVSTPSWIWGVDLTQEIGLNLISWWGQIDIYTYSYAYVGDRKAIDKTLYESIPATDIRKGQFSPTDLVPHNKFFAPARTLGGTRYATMDYIYMRADEMVLLNAEAKAKLNRDAEARTELKKLLALRIDNASYVDVLSGDALKNEIYKQTRIELWGEGKSYLSMKRNKLNVNRGPNHLYFVGQTFPFDADELTFDVPQAEVLNNPNLYN
jgi:hypothetical protein